MIKPAETDGSFLSNKFSFETSAKDKIINYLSENKEKQIETFQLQLICQYCENITIKEKNNKITVSELGELSTIFSRHYDNLINEIPENQRDETRKLIEENMIIDGNRVPLPDKVIISKHKISKELLQKLVNSRLLRSEPNTTGGYSYEISHDTLIEPISSAYKIRREKEEKEKAIFEQQEKLRIAQEKAEKDRMEREKERKRQRKIIAVVVIAAIISMFFGIFGIVNMKKAQKSKTEAEQTLQQLKTEQNLREFEKQKRDSLNYKVYLNKGINQKEKGEYKEAIQSFNFALKFDSTKLISKLIHQCKFKVGLENKFYNLLKTGQNFEQKGESFYTQAMIKYKQAVTLNYNNQLVSNEILRLQGKIDAFVQKAKLKARYLIGIDNKNAKKIWILPALTMKPNDKELKKLYNETNKQ